MFKDFNKYEVFEDGRIWSYKTNKFLKPHTEKNGYQRVWLTDNEGKQKWYYLHRVVYESVSGEPIPEGMDVNHKNEDKTENFFDNLNLMTRKQNVNFGTCVARRAKTNTNNPKHSKQVGAYRNGELVMTFPSVAEAHRQGFHQGNVWACCIGERKTHKGFVWRYI